MANVIQIKRKTTTGAPTLVSLAVGEMCFVIPDETLYLKKDTGTLVSWSTGAGVGDMLKSVFDPTSVNGDAFSMDNMVEGVSTKILTNTERTAIATNSSKTGITAQQASDITSNNAKVSYDTADVDSRVSTAIDGLIGGAPGALDTLNELAAAMGDDAAFSATVTASLATKLDANSTIDGGTI